MPSHVLEQKDNCDTIIVYKTSQSILTDNSLSDVLKILKPGGKFVVRQHDKQQSNVEYELKTNGFINVSISKDDVICNKPNYEVGSSAKLNLKPKVTNVWKLDDTDEDNVETIDPDNLLDDDDFKKPDPSSLKGDNKE